MNCALRARIVTALLLAALVIVVLVGLPPEVAVAMIAVAIFAAGYEWAGFARLQTVPARLAYAAAILLVLTGAERLAADPRWLEVILPSVSPDGRDAQPRRGRSTATARSLAARPA